MFRLTRLALVFLLPLLAACSSREDDSRRLAPQWPVSHDMASTLAFAKDFALRLDARDTQYLNAMFDPTEFDRRIAYGTRNPEVLRTSLSQNPDWSRVRFSDMVMGVMGEEGRAVFLGLFWNRGRPRAFYRLHFPTGVNYLELMIGEDRYRQLRVVDFHDHGGGDAASVRMRRIVTWPRSVADVALGRKPVGLGQALNAMKVLGDKGRYAEALEYWESLPTKVRMDRAVMLRRADMALHVSDSAWLAANRELHEAHAGDGGVALALIGYFMKLKEYDSAMVMINQTDSAIGKDPYLDYLRAFARYRAADYGKSRDYLRRYLASDSSNVDAYVLRMKISLVDGRFIEALQTADVIRERFLPGFMPTALERVDPWLAGSLFYKAFLASPEYAAWTAGNQRDDRRSGSTLSAR